MKDVIFDLFDFNNDGHLDAIEETMAYTALFGSPRSTSSFRFDGSLRETEDEEMLPLFREEVADGFEDDDDEFGLGFLFRFDGSDDDLDDEQTDDFDDWEE